MIQNSAANFLHWNVEFPQSMALPGSCDPSVSCASLAQRTNHGYPGLTTKEELKLGEKNSVGCGRWIWGLVSRVAVKAGDVGLDRLRVGRNPGAKLHPHSYALDDLENG